jgi:hypothetical protein
MDDSVPKDTWKSQLVNRLADILVSDIEKRNKFILGALNEQRTLLETRRAELQRWNADDKALFAKWFGTASEDARQLMLQRIDRMLALNRAYSLSNFTFTYIDGQFAHVYRSDNRRIYLDQSFWSARPGGGDSPGGVLAHEMSHFNTVSGTGDYAYGVNNARRLAQVSRWLPFNPALRNADNFEYYLENPN